MGNYANPRTFVVAWISLFDNELHMQEVKALNSFHALVESRQPIVSLDDTHRHTTMEKLQWLAFNRDAAINVIEIKDGE